MTGSLFPHYANLVEIAVKQANTRELQQAAAILIDHLEEDSTFLRVTGRDQRIQAIRDLLQEKHDELRREEEPC